MRMRPTTAPEAFAEMMEHSQEDRKALPAFYYQHFQDIADLVNLVITLLCENKIRELESRRQLNAERERDRLLDNLTEQSIRAIRASDYLELMKATEQMAHRLFDELAEEESRRLALIELAGALDASFETENSLNLFPVHAADADNIQAATLWLATLLDYFFRWHKQRRYPVLATVFEYINHHVENVLTLQTLVDRCNISQSYLSRLFRTHFQISVTDYIHIRKLRVAQKLLLQTDISAGDIAFRLGYNEQGYFSKVFRKYTGMRVQEYRAQALHAD